MRRRREQAKASKAEVSSPQRGTEPSSAVSVLPPTLKSAGPSSNLASMPAPASLKPCLVVTMKQTESIAGDTKALHQLTDLLKEYPGEDDFYLKVDQETKITTLAFPNIKVKYDEILECELIAWEEPGLRSFEYRKGGLKCS